MTASDALRQALSRPVAPPDDEVRALIKTLEREAPADLRSNPSLLRGVWELRWSSSRAPYLQVAAWLENLQVLDPDRGRAMNLLRLAGPLGQVAGISVEATIATAGSQRVQVTFERGGWLGPRFGDRRLRLFREVRQNFPAWLDITVLDTAVRVSRGNAGTLFALLRRDDLEPESLLPEPAAAANIARRQASGEV